MSKLRVFEAFAGYGSQSRELEELGIDHEVVATSEVDRYAVVAFAATHECFADVEGVEPEYMAKWLMDRGIGWDFKGDKSQIPNLLKKKDNGPIIQLYSAAVGQNCMGDISKLDPSDLPAMDLFTYSFPCQDISVAGHGKGFDEDTETRSSLLWECRKAVQGAKPPVLMMENVKNIVGKKNRPNFDKWCEWLESQGYTNYWKNVNAKECGIPQNRERIFLVSIRKDIDDGSFKFNEDFDSGIRLKDILEAEVDTSYYMSKDKTEDLIRTYVERYGEDYSKHVVAQNELIQLPGQLNMKGNDCEGLAPTVSTCQGGNTEPKVLVREFITPVEGGFEIREATKRGYKLAEPGDSVNLEQPNSKTRRGRVGKGITNTLTTSDNQGVVIRDTEQGNRPEGVVIGDFVYWIRKLTPRECFRLMGLTEAEIDRIQVTGVSNSQQYKLAGNSIVKQAMAFLANLPLTLLTSGNMGN